MNAGRPWNRGKVSSFTLSQPVAHCPARLQKLTAVAGKCPLCGITVQVYPSGTICVHA